jgi:hypothetical protein
MAGVEEDILHPKRSAIFTCFLTYPFRCFQSRPARKARLKFESGFEPSLHSVEAFDGLDFVLCNFLKPVTAGFHHGDEIVPSYDPNDDCPKMLCIRLGGDITPSTSTSKSNAIVATGSTITPSSLSTLSRREQRCSYLFRSSYRQWD